MSSRTFRVMGLLLVPWVVLVTIVVSPMLFSSKTDRSDAHVPSSSVEMGALTQGKTVLVIVDSLREATLEAHMPNLRKMRAEHAFKEVDTCAANFTLVCIQTMLEGRQSPFVARLHNFTGTQGTSKSLPGAAHQTGRALHMISDYTLDSLYGHMATESINVEQWEGSHLEHDLELIRRGVAWIEQPDTDLIILHMIGTDKAAHRKNPGHPEYIHHFEEVDRALKPLIEAIGPEDHLIITGDHGHNEKGHHTKHSVLMAKSPTLEPLLARSPRTLNQTEISYLLAVAAQTPLHLEYEGRYLALGDGASDSIKDEHIKRFVASQVEMLREANYTGDTIQALLADKHAKLALAPWVELARWAPLLILYFLWLMYFWVFWQDPEDLPATPLRATVWMTAFVGVFAFLGKVLPLWAMTGVDVFLFCAAVYACSVCPLRRIGRFVLSMSVVLAMAMGVALLGGAWRDYFHSVGEFIIQVPIFFLGMIGCGVMLSRVYSGRWSKGLVGMLGSVGLFALPGGVYYYQFGRNIVQGAIIGFALYVLHLAWEKRSKLGGFFKVLSKEPSVIATVALSICVAAMLLWQRGSSWIWEFKLKRWLTLQHPEFAWPMFVVLGVVFVWSMRGKKWRALAAGNVALVGLYSVAFGGLGVGTAVGVLCVALGVSLVLRLEGDFGRMFALERSDVLREQQLGFWGGASLLMMGWAMLEGFFFENVDFNFTFKYLTFLKYESDVAAVASVMTYFKYAFVLWLVVVALMNRSRRYSWQRVMYIALWVMHFKGLALMVQIVFGALRSDQKLYELAASDLMFVFAVMLHIVPALFFVGKLAQSEALE